MGTKRNVIALGLGVFLVLLALWMQMGRESREMRRGVEERYGLEARAAETTHEPAEPSPGVGRTKQVGDQGELLRIVDDLGEARAGLRVDWVERQEGERGSAVTSGDGEVALPPGSYFVWVRGRGILDAFGTCELPRQAALVVERESEIRLDFRDGADPRKGVEAKLLLESTQDDGDNTRCLERELHRARIFDRDASFVPFEGIQIPFGPAVRSDGSESISDEEGRIVWRGFPAGTFRWQLTAGPRIAFDPPYEVPTFREEPGGRIQMNAPVRDLSGAFEVLPGALVELHARVLPGARVLGVLVAEEGRPVADARVTLAATARSSSRGDSAVAPEAYARSDSNGSFVFEDCAPGTKLVFAIRDDSSAGSVRLSESGHSFELAEGEEHDLGVISMAGATVRVRTRLIDQHGRPVAVEEAVAEPDPFAALLVSNAIQGEKFYATQFLVRLGDSATYEIHGLSAPASFSLGGGMAGPGLPFTLRPGFRKDFSQTSDKELDPYQEPEVTLDYHLQRVSVCPVSFFLPAGEAMRISTNLHGVAVPAGGGKNENISVDASGPDSFRGELGLPDGKYHYFLATPSVAHQSSYFVRGSIELPCTSPHEAVLTRGITVRGTVTDSAGKPRTQSLVRVGFQGDPVLTGWWTLLATDREGRFALAGIPSGSTLLVEGAREPLALGAVDVDDAHVVISR